MTDIIANVFLFLTAEYFLMSFIIFGYIWLDRDVFLQALKIMLIGMIVNTALKVTFQVPLASFLNKEGYAFPSGHMQLAGTFFGWLAFSFRSIWLRVLVGIALIGIGMGLVHFGYHNYHDVIAAMFIAALLIYIYNQLLTKHRHVVTPITLIFTSILVAYICYRFKQTPAHIWMAYYSLIGLVIGEKLCKKNYMNHGWCRKVLNTTLCVFILAITTMVFSRHNFTNVPGYILDIKSLLIGIGMPFLATKSPQKQDKI